MKGIKKLSILALGLAFVTGLASCGGGGNGDSTTSGSGTTPTPTSQTTPTTTNTNPGGQEGEDTGYFNDNSTEIKDYTRSKEEQTIPSYVQFEDMELGIGDITALDNPSNYPGIYVNPENKTSYELLSITAYTNNVRTTFFLGEEFTSEGLLVLAKFVKLNEDGTHATNADGTDIVIVAKVDTYHVDSANVDTSVMGAYSVQVTFRYGENTKVTTYDISVSSSEYETTPNLQYVAGLKVGYNASKIKTKLDEGSSYKVLQNDGRIYTRYINGMDDEIFDNDFTLDIDQLNINIVQYTVNKTGRSKTQKVFPYNPKDLVNDTTAKKITSTNGRLEIDYSSVDTSKAGSYAIKVKYTGVGFTINGEQKENVVQSFIVVDVINPITSLKLVDSSVKNVEASLDGTFDLSKYEVKVWRKFGGYETMAITSDKFYISGGTSYITGQQAVKVIAMEKSEKAEEKSVIVNLNVTESSKYTFSPVVDFTEIQGTKKDFFKDGTSLEFEGYENATLVDGIITIHNVGASDSSRKSTLENGRTCADDNVKCGGHLKINSMAKESYIEFNITKPGVLILYLSPNNNDSRGFTLLKKNGSDFDVYESDSTFDVKDTPRRFIINVDEAGVYRLTAASTTIQFYGCILATEK